VVCGDCSGRGRGGGSLRGLRRLSDGVAYFVWPRPSGERRAPHHIEHKPAQACLFRAAIRVNLQRSPEQCTCVYGRPTTKRQGLSVPVACAVETRVLRVSSASRAHLVMLIPTQYRGSTTVTSADPAPPPACCASKRQIQPLGKKQQFVYNVEERKRQCIDKALQCPYGRLVPTTIIGESCGGIDNPCGSGWPIA
jgi:hypothetical protein